MLRRKFTGMVAGLTIVSGLLSGCVVDDKENQQSGSQSLTVACGAMEEVCVAWTKGFEAETGIKTSFVRLSSGEAVARLEAAKDAPEFDVWHGGPADGYGAAAKQGLIDKYISPSAEKIPDKYKSADGTWTGVYVGALGFCSNPKVLAGLGLDVPDSWDDLLDPKLVSNISTAHPSTSGTAFTTLWTQVARLGSEDAALAYMRKLHSNVLQYTKSGTAPGQVAGRGEVAVGLVFSHDCELYRTRGMTDLVVSFPSEGTGYEVGGIAVVKGARNLEPAKKYIDWALTAKAQELGPPVGSYQLPTAPGAKIDSHMVKLDEVKLVDYDFVKAADAKKNLTTRFDAEVAAKPKN